MEKKRRKNLNEPDILIHHLRKLSPNSKINYVHIVEFN